MNSSAPLALPAQPASGEVLPVMESFYTLQGEGTHQGKAAYFIRLAGCDVGCVWCDVKESWDREAHPERAVDELVQEASRHPGRLAVVTGGEPLMHPLEALTSRLQQAGFRCHLETSGSHPLSGRWDWICVSPKKFKAPLGSVLAEADELKVVVCHPSDLRWAETQAAGCPEHCRLFLQPEWSRQDRVRSLILEYIGQHPRWQLSLQVHKYLDIP